MQIGIWRPFQGRLSRLYIMCRSVACFVFDGWPKKLDSRQKALSTTRRAFALLYIYVHILSIYNSPLISCMYTNLFLSFLTLQDQSHKFSFPSLNHKKSPGNKIIINEDEKRTGKKFIFMTHFGCCCFRSFWSPNSTNGSVGLLIGSFVVTVIHDI